MIGSDSLKGVCPICSRPGHVCGPDHMTYGPVDIVQKGTLMAEAKELREYTYMIGHMPTTAMLTEEMAERIGAKPVGDGDPEAENGGNNIDQRQAAFGQSAMRDADDNGVVDDNESVAKSRGARNKRAV